MFIPVNKFRHSRLSLSIKPYFAADLEAATPINAICGHRVLLPVHNASVCCMERQINPARPLSQRGATNLEYALLLSLLCIATLPSLTALSGASSTTFCRAVSAYDQGEELQYGKGGGTEGTIDGPLPNPCR